MDDINLSELEAFQEVPSVELEWVRDHSRRVQLQVGDQFFTESQMNEQFYIVLSGEMQVSRTMNGVMRVLGTTPKGIMGGELGLLTRNPGLCVNSFALMPTELLVFERADFQKIFAFAPVFGAYILRIAAQRIGGWSSMLVQQEKMAALGKLSAGLAHELNNPAAAARRAALTLRDSLPSLQRLAFSLCALGLDENQLQSLLTLQHDVIHEAATHAQLDGLALADREEAIAEWLETQQVDGAWECAPVFASFGIELEDLESLSSQLPVGTVSGIMQWLSSALNVGNLLHDLEHSSRRISELVSAIKEYTYMDQAPVQDVDVHRGLENTLRMLRHKLSQITIVREYAPELPLIQGRGGELNQVWTNLIDNAADAMNGQGRLTLITRVENDFVMVEINDDGPGIPEAIRARIFEPFFTTKGVGKGNGLGLDIVYRIVQEHRGVIDVYSQPGATRFIVRLPIRSPLD